MDLKLVHSDKVYNYVKKFNCFDEEHIQQKIDNAHAYEWIKEHIPFFECPDKELEETYYFRWWVYRKHIKETSEGHIITEFLPNVDWAGPYNSINAANGHHIAEGRWLRNGSEYMEEYIHFWLRGSGDQYSYSSWLAYSVYEYCVVKNKKEFGIGLLEDLISYYRHIEDTNMTSCGLFWSRDNRDAMELSISGNGIRPTLNSYMYANAFAISHIALWARKKEIADEYQKKALQLKRLILELLWDDKESFFKVIPMDVQEENIGSIEIQCIPKERNVREAIGFIPWCFNIPDQEQDVAWKFLMDEKYFKANFGPVTAERNHPLYMKPCDYHECVWNGPSWPFATTQILDALISLLHNGRDQWVGSEDLYQLMLTYSKSHYRRNSKGQIINWLDENLDPDTGDWLSRDILKEWGWKEKKGGYERGKDYNHSGFCDIIIRGLCGVQVTEDNRLIINPNLIPEKWDYFCLEKLPYKNHVVTICFDKDGTHYGIKKGFTVKIDDVCIIERIETGKLVFDMI